MRTLGLSAAIFAALIDGSIAWTETKELRLPGELRVVNEGLSHDDQYWYLSNQHFLYKTTVDPMTIVLANHKAIPDELSKRRYDHIGDIDVFEGLIYGGLESSTEDNGILAAWNATDLTIVKYVEQSQKGMPWVAIDPSTRLLYSAVWNDCCNLQVYNVDTFAYVGTVTAANGLPGEIQGGAFYNGDLFMSVNGNCSIYSMNLQTKQVSFVLSDDPYAKHEYEMEGITFWDLTAKGLGVMHFYGNFMQVLEKGIRNFNP